MILTLPMYISATSILGAPATYYLPMVTWRVESAENKRIHDLQWRPMVGSAYHRPMGTLDPPG